MRRVQHLVGHLSNAPSSTSTPTSTSTATVAGTAAATAAQATQQSSSSSLSSLVDHTLLGASATQPQIESLCDEAIRYSFASVCVNPSWVSLCASRLAKSSVKVYHYITSHILHEAYVHVQYVNRYVQSLVSLWARIALSLRRSKPIVPFAMVLMR
jgi:hypothetical protein